MPPKNTLYSRGRYEVPFTLLDIPTASIPSPATGKYEITEANANIVRETIKKVLGCDIDRKDDTFSVIIQMGKLYIHRPHNLKYPNKKRAKRVWKKWRKRYGADYPEQIVLPNCTITTEARGGVFYSKIEAHKIEAQ